MSESVQQDIEVLKKILISGERPDINAESLTMLRNEARRTSDYIKELSIGLRGEKSERFIDIGVRWAEMAASRVALTTELISCFEQERDIEIKKNAMDALTDLIVSDLAALIVTRSNWTKANMMKERKLGGWKKYLGVAL